MEGMCIALISAPAACTDNLPFPTDALSGLTNPVPNTGHSHRGF